MKFCKNLQRVVDISDPEWAPYWPNYKCLKKLIKELPSLVPADDGKGAANHTVGINGEFSSSSESQNYGDMTGGEKTKQQGMAAETDGTAAASSSAQQQKPTAGIGPQKTRPNGGGAAAAGATAASPDDPAATIGKSPGEVAFFKLIHSEFKKCTIFFDRATEEFSIREERVREGLEIMRQPNAIMVNEKWSLMAKSIYRLYKDLLLLETFAIMAYCSFSKILKKHDKVTGYDTKNAFMSNIVNRANFAHYPTVLAMISRCERLYEEVSANLLREGKQGLYEDERLFINMIHRLNEQVLDSSDSEVHGDRKRATPDRSTAASTSADSGNGGSIVGRRINSMRESEATSTLRSLVEENAKIANPAQVASTTSRDQKTGGTVSEEHADDDDDSDDCDATSGALASRGLPAASATAATSSKRARLS